MTAAEKWRLPGLRAVLTMALSFVVLGSPSPAHAVSDSSVPWTTFSESSGCGEPFTATPVASRVGPLPLAEKVLGPFGRYFGWTLAEIDADLVRWTVPNSGGRSIKVHPLALPSYQQVADGLNAALAQGKSYSIQSVYSYARRTISGTHRMSRHALGLALDINPAQNPYRADNKLVTDMPDWFVQIWRDAGFCWGGDWEEIKDPMHLSWMGPTAGSSPQAPLEPLASFSTSAAYGGRVQSFESVFDSAVVASRGRQVTIADGTGNGAPDVVAFRDHEDGTVYEIASATTKWQACSVGRWFIPGLDAAGQDVWLQMDVDGDSRQDVVAIELDGSTLDLSIATRRAEFENLMTITSSIPTSDIAALAGGDYDADRVADLWILRGSGTLEIWSGDDFSNLLHGAVLPVVAGRMSVAERLGGGNPEIFLFADDGSLSVLQRQGINWVVTEAAGLGSVAASGIGHAVIDVDGEARPDVMVLGDDGSLTAYLGNSAVGGAVEQWFFNPSVDCEGETPLVWDGRFADDDESIFVADIESIAAGDVTKGCNPPFNDEFCPNDEVTRGQMAAFLRRALGLPAGPTGRFVDDDGSIFEADIEALAAAGITKGCAPDRYCPGDAVTRGQMAAFLNRSGLGG